MGILTLEKFKPFLRHKVLDMLAVMLSDRETTEETEGAVEDFLHAYSDAGHNRNETIGYLLKCIEKLPEIFSAFSRIDKKFKVVISQNGKCSEYTDGLRLRSLVSRTELREKYLGTIPRELLLSLRESESVCQEFLSAIFKLVAIIASYWVTDPE